MDHVVFYVGKLPPDATPMVKVLGKILRVDSSWTRVEELWSLPAFCPLLAERTIRCIQDGRERSV